uniref:site-specific integrase n=1 Tax=uncultured Acidovorax sp. TaxID=158751 RepID=UPI000AB00D53|nr:site-specific integrase [uncultured Acidovorax sp.]
MNSSTVTRFPGVHRRSDSISYQFGLRAPKDLLAQFPGGWAIRASLNTSDLREANAKAKALHAEWGARFEALRTGKLRPIDMTVLRRRLFEQWERAIARLDETYSRVPGKDRETRAHGLQCQIDELRQCLSGGFLPEWLEDGATKYGDATAPEIVTEYGGHQLMLFEVMYEALTNEHRTFPLRVQYTQQRRDLMGLSAAPAPHALPHPQAPQQPTTPTNGKKISDAYDAWVTIRQAPERTQQTYKRHADQFVALMGDLPLHTVSRTMGIEFRDKLQAWAIEKAKTATTADNILVSLRALFNVARDKGWLTSNPLERLRVRIGGKESEGREPWTKEELGLIFSDPLWTKHAIPTDKKAGKEAAYWIPLIACYTGARLSEIAQLWTDNVATEAGREAFEFKANAQRGQKLKNLGSWRAVPMHPELIRLGFCKYVQSLLEGELFPHLPKAGKNGAGGQFGKWFGTFKSAKGFTSPAKSFHSFRHLVATELRLGVCAAEP